MPDELTNRENLRIKYTELYDKYKALAMNLKEALRGFLNDVGIDVLDVQYRVKEFYSFYEKIQRKGYKEPFDEMEDICGLRIICYYPSDLNKIPQLITNEFEILESTDKADLLEPDRFGYRSLHFIVSIKKEWSKAPNYRGLEHLKAEIQVRTVLMHAWADVEHELAYKKKEHVPPQLRRKLSQLSALFEIADQQLDSVREAKEEYKQSFLLNGKELEVISYGSSQGLNIDNLQAVLDLHFGNRPKVTKHVTDLLDELLGNDVTIEDIEEGYYEVKDILQESEKESFEHEEVSSEEERGWSQVGIVRHVLDLTHDGYWSSREHELPDYVVKQVRKWRAILSGKKS